MRLTKNFSKTHRRSRKQFSNCTFRLNLSKSKLFFRSNMANFRWLEKKLKNAIIGANFRIGIGGNGTSSVLYHTFCTTASLKFILSSLKIYNGIRTNKCRRKNVSSSDSEQDKPNFYCRKSWKIYRFAYEDI